MTDLAFRSDQVEVSPFAWSRIREMGLDVAEVFEVLEHPEVDAPLPSKDDRRMAKAGQLLVLYSKKASGRRVITVAWADPERETVFADDLEMGSAADVAGPSLAEAEPSSGMNEIFLSQLKLWGCTEGRRTGDWMTVRAPNGQMLRVRPPDSIDSTPPVVAERAYQVLGVSAEVFWSRMTKVRPPRERLFAPKPKPKKSDGSSAPEPVRPPERVGPVVDLFPKRFAAKKPKRRSRIEDVLMFFRIRPGATFDALSVADALEFDVSSVSVAVAKLAREGKLDRVSRGRYRLAMSTDDPTSRLAEINAELVSTSDPLRRVELIQERIEVMARLDGAVPDGEQQSSTFVTDPWEDEIDALVELLAPNGVTDEHLDAVEKWRSDTRALIERLRT
jgi:hypothetical protein